MKIQKEAAIPGKLQLLTYGGWIDRDSGKAQDEHPVSEEQYGITPWTTSHPDLALQGCPLCSHKVNHHPQFKPEARIYTANFSAAFQLWISAS